MRIARVLGTVASMGIVAGAAVLVVGMRSPNLRDPHAADPTHMSTSAARSSLTFSTLPATTSAAQPSTVGVVVVPSTTAPSSTPMLPILPGSSMSVSTPAPSSSSHSTPAPPSSTRPYTPPPSSSPPSSPPPVRGGNLPLSYSTADATRVITVTASATWSTVATLQAWTKAPGGGWLKYGGAVTAHVGAQGMTTAPSESKSATPMGTFTLTQAFGKYANPGTGLPYFQTTPSDWWISQSGPLYNTHQHCSSGCGFTLGSPNEHLYYETPYYNYAAVIDYNTRNAPGGVHQGAGSAFFLHVTDGHATAGCVAISQTTLVMLMRWLTPSAHPRILIGVG